MPNALGFPPDRAASVTFTNASRLDWIVYVDDQNRELGVSQERIGSRRVEQGPYMSTYFTHFWRTDDYTFGWHESAGTPLTDFAYRSM